jgi:predicted metal-dependent enzyme (double-stranded beta helix superfamily)
MFRSVASAVAPGATEIVMPKVVGTFPEFLAAAIRRAVRAGGSWPDTADRVEAVLRSQLPGPGLLTSGQLAGDPVGYQTHLVHAEPDGSFSVAVMVWLPGQQTPIHDHLAWCVTAVLQGAECEQIFAVRDGHLEVIARNQNPVGTVSGFAPPGDIHQVHNSGQTVAVSMHVYGTDITRVGSSIRRLYDLPVR